MKKTILVAAVMFIGLTAAAFAQATFQVGSIPVTAVVASGQTERTGDITFTVLSGTSLAGTLTINYLVPITVPLANVTTVPAALVNVTASSNSAGKLVINVPAGLVSGNTILVQGVRVAVAGTGKTTLMATLSAVGNAIVAGQTQVTVIDSISPGIANVNEKDKGSQAGTINAVSATTEKYPIITVKEGFLAAFGGVAEPGNTIDQMVRITLSAAPPAGVSIKFPTTATSDGIATWVAADSDGTVRTSKLEIKSDSSSLAAYYRLATNNDVSKAETMKIGDGLAGAGAASFEIVYASGIAKPLPSLVITFTATLAPIGTAFDSDGNVITSPIPRYAAEEIGPGTFLTIAGKVTTLLVPYGVSALGYDTGFAVSNSTTDPGSTAMGQTGATKQGGTIKFYMYKQQVGTTAPAKYEYTTSATSPGTGLDATGALPTGSTYTVLLSQLLQAAGAPLDFQGYVMIVCNFTNAHALYVASNFEGFSQGAHALVIAVSRNTVPENLNN